MKLEWHIEKRKLKDLKEYHKNPRKISKTQFDHLQRNLEKFGLIDKPFINLDDVIIGGHQRLRVLKKMGYEEIEVHVPNRELTEREVEELNYRHNENGGSWDFDILANKYDHLDLLQWGEDPIKEPKEPTKGKPKVTFEFDRKEDLEKVACDIEFMACEWGAKMKVKL